MPQRQAYKEAVAKWIRMHRELRGWRQRDVAYEMRRAGWVDVDNKMVSNWENARHLPNGENLAALARLFGEWPPSPMDADLYLQNARATGTDTGRELASHSLPAA